MIQQPVHPHLRGELTIRYSISRITAGSSPLTRGTLAQYASHNRSRRFIPAYAGNSIFDDIKKGIWAVHPRLRGELLSGLATMLFESRFIPAYAGNSSAGSIAGVSGAVHPRLRGELGMAAKIAAATAGSSPLTRGTHGLRYRSGCRGRFIPAYAGNSN